MSRLLLSRPLRSSGRLLRPLIVAYRPSLWGLYRDPRQKALKVAGGPQRSSWALSLRDSMLRITGVSLLPGWHPLRKLALAPESRCGCQFGSCHVLGKPHLSNCALTTIPTAFLILVDSLKLKIDALSLFRTVVRASMQGFGWLWILSPFRLSPIGVCVLAAPSLPVSISRDCRSC